MNLINCSNNLSKGFSIELCKFFLACYISYIFFGYMKTKYSTTLTITSIMILMTFNNWQVAFFIILSLYYVSAILSENTPEQKSKITFLSNPNHFDLDEKTDYVQYLAKKHNIPHKIAITYVKYCTKHVNNHVSLLSYTKENETLYFAKSVIDNFKTLVYIGTIKTEIKKDIEKKDDIIIDTKEENDIIIDTKKEEEIKNMDDDKLIQTIKQLLNNTNEIMIDQIIETCNNYKKDTLKIDA